MGRVPLRPVVPIELIGVTGRQRTFGLVDSGSEHTLIAPWLARATGTQPRPEDPELEIGIGGGHRIIRISRLSLALIPPPGTDDTPQIWEAEVGILDHWEAAVVSLDRRIRRLPLTTAAPAVSPTAAAELQRRICPVQREFCARTVPGERAQRPARRAFGDTDHDPQPGPSTARTQANPADGASGRNATAALSAQRAVAALTHGCMPSARILAASGHRVRAELITQERSQGSEPARLCELVWAEPAHEFRERRGRAVPSGALAVQVLHVEFARQGGQRRMGSRWRRAVAAAAA